MIHDREEHLRRRAVTYRARRARAVRPGGRIILADDDYDLLRLWPEPAGFSQVWRAYQRTYDRHAIVGRRLVQLLHQASAKPCRNTWVFFGSCAGQENFDAYVSNLAKNHRRGAR
jgi:hypothetical protein